jgi:hypothetical protein
LLLPTDDLHNVEILARRLRTLTFCHALEKQVASEWGALDTKIPPNAMNRRFPFFLPSWAMRIT